MLSECCQPVKLFSFYSKKKEDGENLYIFDENFFPVYRNIATFRLPLPLCLSEDVDKVLKKIYHPSILCHWDLLAYINSTVDVSLQQITDHSDIVCYHGFLKDLALIPLGGKLHYNYVAFMYDGIVFIEKFTIPSNTVCNKDFKKVYMKRKLKDFCTLSHSKKIRGIISSVNFDEGYYVAKTRVFKTKNSTIKVMFTGEVDAIYKSSQSEQNNFIDIKLCIGDRNVLFDKMTLYNIWARNYIIGIEFIAAGIAKNRAKPLLRKVERLRLSDLESRLPLPVPKIMEYIGKSLESIVDACKKHPKKYVLISSENFSLQIVDEEFTKLLNFSRPTPAFLQAFSR